MAEEALSHSVVFVLEGEGLVRAIRSRIRVYILGFIVMWGECSVFLVRLKLEPKG